MTEAALWTLALLGGWALMGAALFPNSVQIQSQVKELRLFFFVSLGLSIQLVVLTLLAWSIGLTTLGLVLALLGPFTVSLLWSLRSEHHRRAMRQRIWGIQGQEDPPSWHETPSAALLFLLLVLVLSFAIRPPGHWDDTSYHLPMALHYLEYGVSAEIPEHLRFPLFPGAFHLLFAVGLALEGDLLAQMLATAPYWLVLVGLLGAVRTWTGSHLAGLYALAAITFISYVIGVLGFAYLDYGLMLFCWAGALAVLMALRNPEADRTWLLLAALLFATAMSIKLYGVVWAAGWFVLVLMHEQLRRHGFLFLFVLMAFGSFWYVRSALISGDPFHPIGGNWFGHFLWNAEDLASQVREQATHGVPALSFAFWKAFSVAEVLWLTPAFLAPLFMRPRDRSLGLAVLALYGYAGFWFFSSQVDRYLMPWMPVAAFLSAFAFYRFGLEGSFRRLRTMSPFRGALRVSALIPSAILFYWVYSVGEPWLIAARDRGMALSQDLEARKGYALFKAASAELSGRPSSERHVVQVGFENGVYFFGAGKVWGDWFGPARYSRFLDCSAPKCRMRPSEQIENLMREFKSHHLLINTERFDVDPDDYLRRFEILARSPHGVLLRLRNHPGNLEAGGSVPVR